MKIMLVCGAGISTSILMNKMKQYGAANGVDLKINAYGFQEAQDHFSEFDVILVGPQLGYRLDAIKEKSNKPCAVINSLDYGRGNAEAVIKTAKELLNP